MQIFSFGCYSGVPVKIDPGNGGILPPKINIPWDILETFY
jgi:hypothetical protein